MHRLIVALAVVVAGCFAGAAWAANPPRAAAAAPSATAATSAAFEVIERNAAARGGLEAWRKVQTLQWRGHVEGADAKTPPLPFTLELQRPNLTHFEITALTGKFTRIFDGTRGWRLRPGGDGGQETKPFTPEEVGFARDEFVIDGPLIDCVAKGIGVALEGVDVIEGRKAFRLSLKLPTGASRRLWVDAETYLDFRYDRPATSPVMPGATVSVFYRDYATVDGLRIPMRIETGLTRGLSTPEATNRLVIERVVVNPSLPAQAFAKPAVARQRRSTITVGSDALPMSRSAGPPGQ